MSNRYGASCEACGSYVKPNTGKLTRMGRRWLVTHFTCPTGVTKIVTTRFSSGAVVFQNAGGRCIDAPCCGCCS